MTEYRRHDRDLPEALLLDSDGLYHKRLEELPSWERNTVSVAEHLGNPEGFAFAMYEQARRHVEEYNAEVDLNTPWHLLEKVQEWRARWLASQAKSGNILTDIVAQLQSKGEVK